MKKIFAVASIAILAACAEAEAPAPEEEAPAEEVAANDGPGTFEVTNADGTVATVITSEDGTFTYTSGDESGSGTVTQEGDKICFDPEGDDPEQPTNCWTNSEVAEDGSWTSTSDEGETVTVRRVEAVAEAPAEEAAGE